MFDRGQYAEKSDNFVDEFWLRKRSEESNSAFVLVIVESGKGGDRLSISGRDELGLSVTSCSRRIGRNEKVVED